MEPDTTLEELNQRYLELKQEAYDQFRAHTMTVAIFERRYNLAPKTLANFRRKELRNRYKQ